MAVGNMDCLEQVLLGARFRCALVVRCWDTFLALKKPAAKLGICVCARLRDRLRNAKTIPRLTDLRLWAPTLNPVATSTLAPQSG
jgi:hypothetical protein